ncbi:MAG: DedA family protein [Deltaproteobacteria bacterium]|nr:DedA family protein [Deltaproteobacteria bacterium]
MTLEAAIHTYGYAAIAVGTFLEGETILVVGGFVARRGYLELPLVMLAAFTGAVVGDQLWYYLGRLIGDNFVSRRRTWQRPAAKARRWLRQYETLFILTFRFVYGVRTVAPFLIGASRVHPVKFALLNVVSAVTWAVAVAALGYALGQAAEVFLHQVKKYELALLAAIAVIGVALHLFFMLRRRKQPVEAESDDEA